MCRIAASKSDSGTVPENLLLSSIATRFRCFSLDFKLFESIISIT
jgi:organic hydroperoxide reductase OsmC/OhrA